MILWFWGTVRPSGLMWPLDAAWLDSMKWVLPCHYIMRLYTTEACGCVVISWLGSGGISCWLSFISVFTGPASSLRSGFRGPPALLRGHCVSVAMVMPQVHLNSQKPHGRMREQSHHGGRGREQSSKESPDHNSAASPPQVIVRALFKAISQTM